MSETYPLLITCPKGLSSWLRAEVEALGLPVRRELPLGVETQGGLEEAMRLNLWLRTGHRVLLELRHFHAPDANLLHARAVKLPWEEWIPEDGYVTVSAAVNNRGREHSGHAALKIKDAVVDRIRKKTGQRPDSGPDQRGASVFLYWQGDSATLYLDTSGEPLARRGYKLQPHKAPLQETLAAGIVMAAGHKRGHFVNPMCGSGSLACEAALMTLNRAPGLLRERFAFMGLKTYDPGAFQRLCDEGRAAEHDSPGGRIVLTDHDPAAVAAARANAERAGLEPFLEFAVCDFRETEVPEATEEQPGCVILNPEYGMRLGEENVLGEVYSAIGDFFKQRCSGYTGGVFTGNPILAKRVGLKTRRRIPFFNAKIECRLLLYELYQGSRKGE
jgi:putative N6-adenine-specific DNA methylase